MSVERIRTAKPSFAAIAIAVVALCSTAASMSAQSYPDRAIKAIVPYAAGSGADLVSRLSMPKLSQMLNQNIVIENRPGSSGIAGTDAAAKSAPDGYTLLMTATQQVITPSMHKSMPYDMVRDFVPISRLTIHPLVMAVPSSLGVNSVAEFVAYVKARQGKLNYASTGVGSSIHMAGAFFIQQAGLEMAHVPYISPSQAMIGLGRGDIQLMFYGHGPLAAEVQSGRVKMLATTGSVRPEWGKDLPTVKEFYPNYQLYSWQGMFAPAGTPKHIVDILNKGLSAALADPQVMSRFETAGTSGKHLGGEEFQRFFLSEIELYKKIVEISSAKAY